MRALETFVGIPFPQDHALPPKRCDPSDPISPCFRVIQKDVLKQEFEQKCQKNAQLL